METFPTEGIHEIPMELIDASDRLREVDMDWAQLLAGMIEKEGLLNPVEIRPLVNGKFRYKLVAGGHRFAAKGILRAPTILSNIRKLSDLEARLHEIDENLGQRTLSPFDRATFMAQRQEVYLELYPATAQGTAGAEARWHATENFSFASETAQRLGVSERLIRMYIRRYRAIAPDVREKIKGSWIADHGVTLDALARMPPSDQRKAITLMLRAENPVKSATKALDQALGRGAAATDVDAEQLRRLMEAWGRAGHRAKNQFIAWMLDSSSAEFVVGLEAQVDLQLEKNAKGG